MKRWTKLEAVNHLLPVTDGSTASSLDAPLDSNVIEAINFLDASTEIIQTSHQWRFNQTGIVTLTSDTVTGDITTPDDFLDIQLISWTNGNVSELTVRGGRIWNSKQSTYQVPGSVEVIGSRFWEFEDLPLAIQRYAMERAKWELATGSAFIGPARPALTSITLEDAKAAAFKWDNNQQFNTGGITNNSRQRINGRHGRSSRFGWWGS